MAGKSNYTTKFTILSDREVLITRVFDAPRELVFQAYTDREIIPQWWGPRVLITTIDKMEVKIGGSWRFVQEEPNGRTHAFHGVFREIVVPSKLVQSFEYEGMPGQISVTTTTFEEREGKTLLTTQIIFESKEQRDGMINAGMEKGQNESMERLEEQLALKFFKGGFVIARELDAPRDLVFKVWTQAEHLMRWFGPKGVTISQAKMDFRPGGYFHYSAKSPDGETLWGKWAFREIVPPEKLVLVSSFSDAEGKITRHPWVDSWPLETLAITTFEEHKGKTMVVLRWIPIHETEAERNTFNGSYESMDQGWTGTFEQLAEYLTSV